MANGLACVEMVVCTGRPPSHLPLVQGELDSESIGKEQGGCGTGNDLVWDFITVVLNN